MSYFTQSLIFRTNFELGRKAKNSHEWLQFWKSMTPKKNSQTSYCKDKFIYRERGGVAVPKRDDIVGLGLKLAIFLVNYQPTA